MFSLKWPLNTHPNAHSNGEKFNFSKLNQTFTFWHTSLLHKKRVKIFFKEKKGFWHQKSINCVIVLFAFSFLLLSVFFRKTIPDFLPKENLLIFFVVKCSCTLFSSLQKNYLGTFRISFLNWKLEKSSRQCIWVYPWQR